MKDTNPWLFPPMPVEETPFPEDHREEIVRAIAALLREVLPAGEEVEESSDDR